MLQRRRLRTQPPRLPALQPIRAVLIRPLRACSRLKIRLRSLVMALIRARHGKARARARGSKVRARDNKVRARDNKVRDMEAAAAGITTGTSRGMASRYMFPVR